jgi:hypothetical protein
VQVYVKHVLHAGLAICEEEIHAVTGESTPAESRRGSVADAHQVGSGFRVQVSKVGGMARRDHQEMPEVDRLDVHERGAAIVAIDETGRELTVQDTTEDALAH